MTLTERIEFKDLKELQNLKTECFEAMKEVYGVGMTYSITQSDENYFHLEFKKLYTTGTEKDCFTELLKYLNEQIEDE